ncbi:MAG: GNAT family protein [Dehalococcoidia bacterium]
MVVLSGPRLVLRDLEWDDFEAVHAYSARPEVARYQPWGPNTRVESRVFLERALAAAQDVPRTIYQLGVTVATSGQLIGTAALTVHSFAFGQAELGYFLHPDAWGNGYATEAARMLLAFGFTELNLHRIFGTCDPRNTASARVMENVGMVQEGHLRETMRIRDGWRDSLIYSILADDFRHAAANPRTA